MEKYAVVTEQEAAKLASHAGRPCPECGSGKVNYSGVTPHCPECGTRPWEPRGQQEDRKE